MLINILLSGHLLLAIAIVALVLLQQGRGSDAGAVFGGSSQSVFGSRGPATFMSRITALLATLFFINCLVLAWLYNRGLSTDTVTTPPVIQQLESSVTSEVPEVPGTPDAATEQGTAPAAGVPAAPPQQDGTAPDNASEDSQ